VTFTDEATWYASLATMYASAAALITSPSGEVLLVKPNYRELWSLPGGILEEPTVAFVFDGGELRDFTAIVLQESELDGYRLVAPSALPGYLPPRMTARVSGALRARASGTIWYLSD
jgi:hypothetical protein